MTCMHAWTAYYTIALHENNHVQCMHACSYSDICRVPEELHAYMHAWLSLFLNASMHACRLYNNMD